MGNSENSKVREAHYNLCQARRKAEQALEEFNRIIHELLKPYIFTETRNTRVRLAPRRFGYVPEELRCLAFYQSYLDEDLGESFEIERTIVIQRDEKIYDIDYEFWAKKIQQGLMVKRASSYD